MKKLIAIFVLLLAGMLVSESEARSRYSEVNFGYFYNNLQPHGEWIQIDYDVYVWKPYRVARNWSPYSVGHWEYTSYGWYWESYEPFGWATYHYGRWYYDDYYDWVWVPGYEWGPSWVEWRYSNNYIGWSPLPPYAEFRINVGIHFSISYRTSYHYWNFVNYNHFCQPRVHNHFVGVGYKNRIFNSTKYRTNYHARGGRIINGGIDRNYVERRAGTRIRERDVTRTTNLRDYTGTRGNQDRIVSYRPDEREVQKYRNSEVRNVSKASERSSLRKEMVTFRDREDEVRKSTTVNRDVIQKDDRYRTESRTNNESERRVTTPRTEVQRDSRTQSRQRVDSPTPRLLPKKETKSTSRPAVRNNQESRSTKSVAPRNPVRVEVKPKSQNTRKSSPNVRSSKSNTRKETSVKRSTSSQRENKSPNRSSRKSSTSKKRDR